MANRDAERLEEEIAGVERPERHAGFRASIYSKRSTAYMRLATRRTSLHIGVGFRRATLTRSRKRCGPRLYVLVFEPFATVPIDRLANVEMFMQCGFGHTPLPLDYRSAASVTADRGACQYHTSSMVRPSPSGRQASSDGGTGILEAMR